MSTSIVNFASRCWFLWEYRHFQDNVEFGKWSHVCLLRLLVYSNRLITAGRLSPHPSYHVLSPHFVKQVATGGCLIDRSRFPLGRSSLGPRDFHFNKSILIDCYDLCSWPDSNHYRFCFSCTAVQCFPHTLSSSLVEFSPSFVCNPIPGSEKNLYITKTWGKMCR